MKNWFYDLELASGRDDVDISNNVTHASIRKRAFWSHATAQSVLSSAAIISACLSTVSVASSCMSGG